MTNPSPQELKACDATWLRQIAVQGVSNEFSDGAKDRLERIANRLEALSQPRPDVVERVARAMCGRDLANHDCEAACMAAGKCVGTLSPSLIADAKAATAAVDASDIGRMRVENERLREALRSALAHRYGEWTAILEAALKQEEANHD